MAIDDHNDQAVLARRVRLAVAELDRLSVWPSVCAVVTQAIAESRFSASDILPMVEVSPELTILALGLAYEQGLRAEDYEWSLSDLLLKIPSVRINQAFLALKPSPAPDAWKQDEFDAAPLDPTSLNLHSVAVAQGARQITLLLDRPLSASVAYLAGLLHDIGKFALLQVMPKGYMRLIDTALASQRSLYTHERMQLGVDHSSLGAYLGQRWHIPVLLHRIIRLHHQRLAINFDSRSDFVLAGVVQIANNLAKQKKLGVSGSVGQCSDVERLMQVLGLKAEQLDPVVEAMSQAVQEARDIMRLEMDDPQQHFCNNLHDLALRLQYEQGQKRQSDQEYQIRDAFLQWIQDILSAVDGAMDVLDVAEHCIRHWQRFFQTGKVCLFLFPSSEQAVRQLVWIDELGHSTKIILDQDLDGLIETPPPGTDIKLSDARDWLPLFEEIEVPFASSRTKAIVLRCRGCAVGAIAFESNMPGDMGLQKEYGQFAGQILACLLHMASTREMSEDTVEGLLTLSAQIQTPSETTLEKPINTFGALAEMAAGLAHELNNPLSVISGRAQLLSEEDIGEKNLQALQQIRDNTAEVAQLVEALLGFAEPSSPRSTSCSLKATIDDAMALAQRKLSVSSLDVQRDYDEICPEVWIDSAQIASSIANIITNAFQSYDVSPGVVYISVKNHPRSDTVMVQIRDFGRGMDQATLKRAVQPFFSAQAAGRRRGLGLAYAQRLIELNGGSLSLTSEVGQGTTASITLPTSNSTR
jgi:nitrogen-specific signal transduction histidine kinase